MVSTIEAPHVGRAAVLSRAPFGHLRWSEAISRERVPFAARREQPLVSVIVPTHNRRELVIETVRAIGRQRFRDFELIVVDDGSVDGTAGAVLAEANALGITGCVERLLRNSGPAHARNAGVLAARGEIIAFTDSDCLPTPYWLERGVAAMRSRDAVVQGRTTVPPGAIVPFFSHFMHIDRMDGTFSTCNVVLRRARIEAIGGFDPGCKYWEDVDLGWRAIEAGAVALFEPSAIVYHQVMPQRPLEWMWWPSRLSNWPAIVKRHPGARSALTGGTWLNGAHALMTLAGIAPALARWRRPALLLALPYLVSVPARHGLSGKKPLVKAALHAWWDVLGFASLVVASVRHRRIVL